MYAVEHQLAGRQSKKKVCFLSLGPFFLVYFTFTLRYYLLSVSSLNSRTIHKAKRYSGGEGMDPFKKLKRKINPNYVNVQPSIRPSSSSLLVLLAWHETRFGFPPSLRFYFISLWLVQSTPLEAGFCRSADRQTDGPTDRQTAINFNFSTCLIFVLGYCYTVHW